MIIGAVSAGLSVVFVVLATRPSSMIERRLREVDVPRPPWISRSPVTELVLWRICGGLLGAMLACVASWAFGLGLLPIPLASYCGYVLPTVVDGRRAGQRRRDAERAMITLVEWLHALTGAGRPIEVAIASVTLLHTGSPTLDAGLARIRRDYTLGVPLHQALAREGSTSGIRALAQLADRLERARDLGRGVLPIIQELRDELRSVERAAALEAASHVEGKLTLVLTLCYLPALALVVIIPLFLTLLARLFA